MHSIDTLENELSLCCWQAQSDKPHAIVHILHGMGEHKLRYAHFANFLNTHHITVYAHDHSGHGAFIQSGNTPGHYGDSAGFHSVLQNVHVAQQFIRNKHPDTPIFILGHSMGSFIAQSYLIHYSCPLQGLILSGSAYTPVVLLHALKWLARFESVRVGKAGYSKVIDQLSFGSYNKAFQPQRTPFDWLSRDTQQVDQYIEDELCGFICSAYSWYELAHALIDISKTTQLEKIPAELPCLIISGDKDPVGAHGKYVSALHQHWLKTGHRHTRCELLKDARHEVLNETDRELTYNLLLNWINELL